MITLLTMTALLQASDDSPWLADRGDGVHTSLFGTYVRERELLIYGFYEYTINRDNEYKPEDFGFVGATDYTAKRVESEFLLYAAYGITRDLMVEMESAVRIRGTQFKASSDTSAMPNRLSEDGLGDTEGQLRWRFLHETEKWPEVFAFLEIVAPLQRSKVVIGTQGWEFAWGVNITKGFAWGTLSARFGMVYTRDDTTLEFGEYAIEYVKKLSEMFRVVVAIEGEQDEIAAIFEVQVQPRPGITIKLNSGFGLTSKAPDWAPEIGLMVSF